MQWRGPTPVSALIHAATMVAAGVFMLARVGFLIEVTEVAASVIATIGAITAVIAALMALQQNDIKRILAYSTLSQLGYMVMAQGISTTVQRRGCSTLYTHALFQSPSLPWIRRPHIRLPPPPGYLGYGWIEKEDADHLLDLCNWNRCSDRRSVHQWILE